MNLHPDRYYVEFAEACAKFIKDRDCTKYFKRYDPELPRISKVLGILKSINPTSILDVGPGKGRSLWPMLEALPKTSFLCVDQVEWRCKVINAVHDGGVKRVQAVPGDMLSIPYGDNYFDVVTALEVMEHIPLIKDALYQVMRVSKQFVVLTVPSKPDRNPEHVHFFNQKCITDLIREIEPKINKEVTKIQIEYAGNSMIVLIGFQRPKMEMANVGSTYCGI
jgi:ubiquinone/menaquinone biosynthesis C-methylase UbiE